MTLSSCPHVQTPIFQSRFLVSKRYMLISVWFNISKGIDISVLIPILFYHINTSFMVSINLTSRWSHPPGIGWSWLCQTWCRISTGVCSVLWPHPDSISIFHLPHQVAERKSADSLPHHSNYPLDVGLLAAGNSVSGLLHILTCKINVTSPF